DASSAVSRSLPATVAVIGRAGVYRFTYGCAADHGASAAPPSPAVATSASACTAAGVLAAVPPISASSSSSARVSGSASHSNCSSRLYGAAESTLRHESIAPVGHGE